MHIAQVHRCSRYPINRKTHSTTTCKSSDHTRSIYDPYTAVIIICHINISRKILCHSLWIIKLRARCKAAISCKPRHTIPGYRSNDTCSIYHPDHIITLISYINIPCRIHTHTIRVPQFRCGGQPAITCITSRSRARYCRDDTGSVHFPHPVIATVCDISISRRVFKYIRRAIQLRGTGQPTITRKTSRAVSGKPIYIARLRLAK